LHDGGAGVHVIIVATIIADTTFSLPLSLPTRKDMP
jgi:hypothetical protein